MKYSTNLIWILSGGYCRKVCSCHCSQRVIYIYYIPINYARCHVCRNTSNGNYVISYNYVHLHDEIQLGKSQCRILDMGGGL